MAFFEKNKWELIDGKIGMNADGCKMRARDLDVKFRYCKNNGEVAQLFEPFCFCLLAFC